MAEILESEWTLDALKRREEERLKNERVSATRNVAEAASDGANLRPPSENEISGNNWLAQAFRRRQEEQRAKEILNEARSRDLAQTAESKSSPIDDWLVAGFRRHEEEQRHMAQVASALDVVSNPGVEVVSSISEAPSLVAIQNTAIAPKNERPRAARRLISMGGLIVVAGLLALLALRATLFAPPKSPALVKTPPTPPSSVTNPREGASFPAEAERPVATKPSETDVGATPPVQTPANIEKQSVAIPEGQQKPASGASAPADGSKPEAAPPMTTEGKSTTEAPTVDPAKSRETTEPEKDQNASEAKQPTAGKKTKGVKNKSSAGRHSSRGTDAFSAFLTRTTNSVRKFFGR